MYERRSGNRRASSAAGSGSVTTMNEPTGASRRRYQPNGPCRDGPVAISTCFARSFAARGHDPVRAAVFFDRRDRRVLEEPRAVACRRVREPHGELAHVHLAAMLLQQAAVKAVRLDFAANPVAADQFDIGIDFAPDQLGGLFEMFEVMRLRSELQLAGSEIVAVDLLFADQPLDRLDRRRIRAITAARTLGAELRVERHVVLRDARVALPAVAARRAAAHAARIEHRHRRAALARAPAPPTGR